MAIVIMNILWRSCSSINKFYDENISLRSKQSIYKELFNIDCNNLPDITSIHRSVYLGCTPYIINWVDSFNPDVYINYIDDKTLDFTKSKPKLVILFDLINRKIKYGDITVDVVFEDVDEATIKSYIGRILLFNGNGKICENIEDIRAAFNLEIPNNCKYFSYGYTTYANKYFSSVNPFIKIAFINVTRRLILEYIMQYRDNPTINAPKKDNKTELLTIIDNLQMQINDLKERIANM